MSDNDLDEMKKMIADYMESGFLDNIIAMFRQDKSLYSIIGDIIGDERLRVRIGTIALVESLIDEDYVHLHAAIPGIAEQLHNSIPSIRGDAAHLLGIIGHKDALPYLVKAQDEGHEHVKEVIDESIEAIRQNALSEKIINGE
ncbi:MAG: HEAT repeat domain-containing protein [Thermodesulfovibrionia bacterium]|nr:HEAT repeat domain-containing protein [Thermodesulfovibrionia bacterium]